MRAILFLTVSPLPGEKGMWLGTVGGGLCKSLSAFLEAETNYKRALKLSAAAAVFSAFLCLPLAVGWVNCSDSGTIVHCQRAMEAQGLPCAGGAWHGAAARPGIAVWGRAWAGLCLSTPVAWGQSLPVPQGPQVHLCPSLVSLGNVPNGAFGNSLEMASLGGRRRGVAIPQVSFLPAMGKVLLLIWVVSPVAGTHLAQTCPVLEPVPSCCCVAFLLAAAMPGRAKALSACCNPWQILGSVLFPFWLF